MNSVLDDRAKRSNIDKNDMLGVVASLPHMLPEAEKIGDLIDFRKIKKPNLIVVVGMGGSAIGGDIAASLFPDIPIIVNRGYSLPRFVNDKTLLIAVSYSGNTEEVLFCLKEAKSVKLPVICITSGGKLAEIAEQEKYLLVEVKPGLQPRSALPYLCLPLLMILEKLGKEGNLKSQIKETIELLGTLREEYLRDERSNEVKQLAKKLQGKLPLIFATQGNTEAVGLRLKTQFNENSKVTAHLSLFPELNHNEIANLAELRRGQHNFALILLRDEEDTVRVQKRIEITKSLIGANLGGANEIISRGRSRLARLFSLIFFGDFLTVYLAILLGVDPTPVEVIQRLKKEMLR